MGRLLVSPLQHHICWRHKGTSTKSRQIITGEVPHGHFNSNCSQIGCVKLLKAVVLTAMTFDKDINGLLLLQATFNMPYFPQVQRRIQYNDWAEWQESTTYTAAHHQGAIETFWFDLCGQNCLGFFAPVARAEVKMITMSTLIIVALWQMLKCVSKMYTLTDKKTN